MSGNDERGEVFRLEGIREQVEQRKQYARENVIPYIKELCRYAEMMREAEIHNVKIGDLRIERQYRETYDGINGDFESIKEWLNRYKVYHRHRLKEEFVLEFNDMNVYRYIHGNWVGSLPEKVHIAKEKYEHRIIQRCIKELQRAEVHRTHEEQKLMKNFGLE